MPTHRRTIAPCATKSVRRTIATREHLLCVIVCQGHLMRQKLRHGSCTIVSSSRGCSSGSLRLIVPKHTRRKPIRRGGSKGIRRRIGIALHLRRRKGGEIEYGRNVHRAAGRGRRGFRGTLAEGRRAGRSPTTRTSHVLRGRGRW